MHLPHLPRGRAAMLAAALFAGTVTAPAPVLAAGSGGPPAVPDLAPEAPSLRILASIEDRELARIAAEALADNPQIAAARAMARAARARAPQVASLPDPMAGATLFLAPPETRVGPQRLMVSLSQRLPWFGKLDLAERAAVLDAAAVAERVEAVRLDVLTQVRTTWSELAFLGRRAEIVGRFRDHLEQHEELARSRYSVGRGGSEGVIRLQAEITRAEQELVAVASRRAELVARLNALRSAPVDAPLPTPRLPERGELPLGALDALSAQELVEVALDRRPELAAAAAEIARFRTLAELAALDRRPDVTLGLTYTLVEERDDRIGRTSPPEDDGRDVFGLTGSVNLPVWRERIAAAVTERNAQEAAAFARRAGIEDEVRRSVGEVVARLPLLGRELELIEDLLLVQADEAIAAAAAAYSAGRSSALELFEAEHMSYRAETAAARLVADLAAALARLEGAVAAPLEVVAPDPGMGGPGASGVAGTDSMHETEEERR